MRFLIKTSVILVFLISILESKARAEGDLAEQIKEAQKSHPSNSSLGSLKSKRKKAKGTKNSRTNKNELKTKKWDKWDNWGNYGGRHGLWANYYDDAGSYDRSKSYGIDESNVDKRSKKNSEHNWNNFWIKEEEEGKKKE